MPRSSDPCVRRSRASTLLYATTTQKVASPMMIVQRLKFTPVVLIAVRRAIPVMMPGSAIGRTSRNERLSLPKKRNRCTAKAAQLPSTRAISVAIDATFKEFTNAFRMLASPKASSNHLVVKLFGGHTCATLSLKA